MNNNLVAKRVKELRTSNGFSQEVLAEKSKLNLRTIQRIESGKTMPRGDSLLRISSALNIFPDELLDWTKEEDKGQLLLINMSGLSFILNPFLGIIIPIVLWVSKRDKVQQADETGKELLNFQITWLVILLFFLFFFIFYVILFQQMDISGVINSPTAAIILIFFLGFYYLYSIILILNNTIRIQKDQKVKYKPAFRILK